MSSFFGVNRFDGSHFVQMNNAGDSASMQTDYLRGLIWLDRRRLAVYSDGLYVKEYVRGEGGVIIMSNGAGIEVSRRKKEQFLTKVKASFKC